MLGIASQVVKEKKERIRTILTDQEKEDMRAVLRKSKNFYTQLVAAFLRTHLLAPQPEEIKEQILRFRTNQKAALIDENDPFRGVRATEDVEPNQWVCELTGKFSLESEARDRLKLEWGSTHHLYESLTLGDPAEPICLEAWKQETVGKYIRRSCKPNCQLIHFFGTELHFMVVALEPLKRGDEMTLALEPDCSGFKTQLRCVEHQENPTDCPEEKKRLMKMKTRKNPRAFHEVIELSDSEEEQPEPAPGAPGLPVRQEPEPARAGSEEPIVLLRQEPANVPPPATLPVPQQPTVKFFLGIPILTQGSAALPWVPAVQAQPIPGTSGPLPPPMDAPEATGQVEEAVQDEPIGRAQIALAGNTEQQQEADPAPVAAVGPAPPAATDPIPAPENDAPVALIPDMADPIDAANTMAPIDEAPDAEAVPDADPIPAPEIVAPVAAPIPAPPAAQIAAPVAMAQADANPDIVNPIGAPLDEAPDAEAVDALAPDAAAPDAVHSPAGRLANRNAAKAARRQAKAETKAHRVASMAAGKVSSLARRLDVAQTAAPVTMAAPIPAVAVAAPFANDTVDAPRSARRAAAAARAAANIMAPVDKAPDAPNVADAATDAAAPARLSLNPCMQKAGTAGQARKRENAEARKAAHARAVASRAANSAQRRGTGAAPVSAAAGAVGRVVAQKRGAANNGASTSGASGAQAAKKPRGRPCKN